MNPETLKAVHLLANLRRAALGIKRPISKQTTQCVLEAAQELREEIERVKDGH